MAGGWADATLPPAPAARLLGSAKIAGLADGELWRDLTAAEQAAAADLARGLPPNAAGVRLLEQFGLVTRPGPADAPSLFCPLFLALVQCRPDLPGAVQITAGGANEARVTAAAGEERVALPPRVFALLLALSRSPGQVVPAGEIIEAVYGAEASGVTDAALAQLVKRLRRALDPPGRRLARDPNYCSVETIRTVGYRLNG